MTDPLIRFLDAQDQIFGQVVDELTHGRKQTHWMWFIFPQLVGLGRSAMAQHYAIKNLARRYLADTTLGVRLREAALFREAASEPRPVHQSLGSVL